MAVTKIWPVRNRLDHVLDYAKNPEKTSLKGSRFDEEKYQSLQDVLAYAKDEEKTERELFCEGINCNPSTARDQFLIVKKQFAKTDGIQAYHGYLSFKEENITPEIAQKIGMEFANAVWGKRFQVVVTTHLNTKHLHCHFVINSVSFVDGKRLQNEEKAWFHFRHIADEICKSHGLYFDPNPNRSKKSSYGYRLEKEGISTRFSMAKKAVDEAIENSRTIREFEYYLKSIGYSYQLSPSTKYWTIVPKGWKKPIRLRSFGEDYTRNRILERLEENRGKLLMRPFHSARISKPQYRLPTRENKLRKVGGLRGLYLYYCYRLGSLPRYNRQQEKEVSYWLRDDLYQLNKLTAQTDFLCRYHIETGEQFANHRTETQKQIKKLTDDRTVLRNQIRRTSITDEERTRFRNDISKISEQLKKLRTEMKLCDQIAERSGIMQEKLQQVFREEQSIKKKDRGYR